MLVMSMVGFRERGPTTYDIGFFCPGLPGATIENDEALFTFRADRDFWLPSGLISSTAGLHVAPADDLVFIIMRNEDPLGTVTFVHGTLVGTFDMSGDAQFNSGDALRVLRPHVIDTDAKDLSITFAGRKGIIS